MNDSNEYDVIVVGGGIMGSCAAAYLALASNDVANSNDANDNKCKNKDANNDGYENNSNKGNNDINSNKFTAKRILLLEKYEFNHSNGSSHGQSRIIRQAYPSKHHTEMAMKSFDLWLEMEKLMQTKVIKVTGGLDFAPHYNEDLQNLIESLDFFGIPRKVLTSDEIANRWPQFVNVSTNNVDSKDNNKWIGVYCADRAGIINPEMAVTMFQNFARQYGATLMDQTEVVKIEKLQQSDDNKSDTYSTILKVITNTSQVFYTKKCIIAPGAWASEFLENVLNVKVNVKPLQTSVMYWKKLRDAQLDCTIDTDNPTANETFQFPVFIQYETPCVYGFPEHEVPNHYKICLHDGPACDPNKQCDTPDETSIKVVSDFIRTRMNTDMICADAPNPEYSVTCMYSMTCDSDFIIDAINPWPNNNNQHHGIVDECTNKNIDSNNDSCVYVAAGFSGHGFKMAPIIGKMLSLLVTTGSCSQLIDRSPFSINRPGVLRS